MEGACTPKTKLPKVGTTIFTVMSQLAVEHQAVNLGQGFPDFDVPERLVEALDRAMRDGHNQYAPMTGIPALRQAIAAKTERVLRRAAECRHRDHRHLAAPPRRSSTRSTRWCAPGEEVIVLDPCYDCYEPAIELAGARAVHVPLDPRTFAPDWQTRARRDHAAARAC